MSCKPLEANSRCLPCVRTQAESKFARRPASSKPIQQLTGHVSSHDNQYQCGQPLLQLGIVAAIPIASPKIKNQSTCFAARPGANRAHSHAQKIDTITKSAVLVTRALFEGMRPLTKSPGKIRESNGSVAKTRITDSK